MLPLPAAASPCVPSAPFSAEAPAISVSYRVAAPAPITVATSSSDSDSSVSSPPHLALSSALPSVLLAFSRYFPPAPVVLLSSGRSFDCLRRPGAVVVVPVASFVSLPPHSVPCGVPHLSLFWAPPLAYRAH